MEPPPSNPRVPADMEREIFEIAALARPTAIPILMLVAKRVKDWVEPLLYRVLVIFIYYRQEMRGFPVITPEILQRVVATQPPQFLQNHVKHLFLKDLRSSELETILAACSGVTNLYSYPAHLGCVGRYEESAAPRAQHRDVLGIL
ncbi:hypothetical protein DFH08DRAFT_889920 [Mycena albidolilacea]|uniref:Uncharacterized protein n=1 Tax=Mycena albidolilacea TaxID=1033008 RepID=A0AAD6ZGW1_9AGAR|nr:hypothetical protein DFH08DRAFT_889920 [Mycena albidolilacea]